MPAPKKKKPSVRPCAAPSGGRPSAAPPSAMMRVEVTYRGRVQGVGFRFNAEQVALQCGVTGWVRNEHNGDVMMVAEGRETQLKELLEGIRRCPVGRHIAKEQVRWEACRNEFCDFKIEYHL